MRRITGIMLAGLLAGLACGCGQFGPMPRPTAAAPAAEPASTSGYLGQTAIRDESDNGAPSAVDAALEWARKYSEVSTQRDELLNENRTLTQEKQTHELQLAEMRHRAEQAERELAEANAMLMEIRGELNQWKASVLGFRGEMLDAQKAQLAAMYKIMRLIGGEVAEPVAQQTAQADVQENSGAASQ